MARMLETTVEFIVNGILTITALNPLVDGPPPCGFGEKQHTGGLPPWRSSPLVPPCEAPYSPPCGFPCSPPCGRCRPPNYNAACDPQGEPLMIHYQLEVQWPRLSHKWASFFHVARRVVCPPQPLICNCVVPSSKNSSTSFNVVPANQLTVALFISLQTFLIVFAINLRSKIYAAK